MPIYIGSRYERAKVARVFVSRSERRPSIFAKPPPDAVFDFSTHVVVEGDRLDLIAHSVYGDPALWHVIADANPELEVPEPLVPGTVLRIPGALR